MTFNNDKAVQTRNSKAKKVNFLGVTLDSMMSFKIVYKRNNRQMQK